MLDIGIDRLMQAAHELEDGNFDAMLGGGAFKQRVARPGRGKSGGARMLLAFRREHRIVFIEIFAKNDFGNISANALAALRAAATLVLDLDDRGVNAAVQAGHWVELSDE